MLLKPIHVPSGLTVFMPTSLTSAMISLRISEDGIYFAPYMWQKGSDRINAPSKTWWIKTPAPWPPRWDHFEVNMTPQIVCHSDMLMILSRRGDVQKSRYTMVL